MPTRALAALALTILVWGAAPAFIRSVSLAAGPADALVIRTVLVALLFLPIVPFAGGFQLDRADWPRLALISFIGMFGYFFGSIFGFAYVTTGVGGIIISLQPLTIALLAAAVGAERIGPATMIGLAVSFIGTVLLFGGDVGQTGSRAQLILGGLMIFGCGLCWAIYVVFSKPLIQRYGALKITALSSIFGALPSFALISRGTVDTLLGLDGRAWFGLFYLCVIGTLLTASLWNYAVGQLKPSTVGASLYMIPVLAALSGVLILGESITFTMILAGSVILAGVTISQFGALLLRKFA